MSERQANAGDDATVVGGHIAKGRAVLCGINLGCRTVEAEGKYWYLEEISPEEAALLINGYRCLNDITGVG